MSPYNKIIFLPESIRGFGFLGRVHEAVFPTTHSINYHLRVKFLKIPGYEKLIKVKKFQLLAAADQFRNSILSECVI